MAYSRSGRFSRKTDARVEGYTQSVSFDRAMYGQDIAGSRAHAAMLARQGVISPQEAQALRCGLETVRREIESGSFKWSEAQEDLHMNVEARLTRLIGPTGGKLHTGRSRNDQVALDFRLFVADSLKEWRRLVRELARVFVRRADEHRGVLMPGCTHLQPGQPISLAHHLLAYAWMLKRDAARMEEAEQRARISPLGAGALAGTTYPVDPRSVAEELGMGGVFDNSMDAVSDRDFALEALFCASVAMMHLSRFCEELILWANPHFGYILLPDGYATGSSIMPQKKNPDVAELMRGRVGRVYGDLFALLTVMKGLPLTYNRDMQEDKEPFMDASRTVAASLAIMAEMLAALEFRPERMRQALSAGFLNATELADYLVGKGLPFRRAHYIAGRAVALAEQRGLALESLPLADLRRLCRRIGKDVYEVLDYETAVARRNSHGGTGPLSVDRQIRDLRVWLEASPPGAAEG
jgi:argininosuccinate lyase